MKKIGILHGKERTFPQAFVERVNSMREPGITAERVRIDKVVQGEPTEYAVIIDRISQDVPFYRAYLKNAALNGTAVINNPFWWSADEKFFNNCLATKVGVAVPKTVLLPSKEHPADCSAESFSNLAYPLDWEGIFRYIGWPAYFKPHAGGGWKNVYKVRNPDEFFKAYAETGQLVMLLQEEVKFDDYYRCYCIGQEDVLVMPYEPRNAHHLRYVVERPPAAAALLERIERDVLTLNRNLGYDFNTVEFAVRDGIPIAIDFCNPAPDADRASVGEKNFAWVVDAAARLAVRKAKEAVPGAGALSWGKFVRTATAGEPLL
jgi:glutathione synthase/RimK-type ligase-like ATP-grasp enzyme